MSRFTVDALPSAFVVIVTGLELWPWKIAIKVIRASPGS
jgi:hypothetical protein